MFGIFLLYKRLFIIACVYRRKMQPFCCSFCCRRNRPIHKEKKEGIYISLPSLLRLPFSWYMFDRFFLFREMEEKKFPPPYIPCPLLIPCALSEREQLFVILPSELSLPEWRMCRRLSWLHVSQWEIWFHLENSTKPLSLSLSVSNPVCFSIAAAAAAAAVQSLSLSISPASAHNPAHNNIWPTSQSDRVYTRRRDTSPAADSRDVNLLFKNLFVHCQYSIKWW